MTKKNQIIPTPLKFDKLSIIIATINETSSLRKTVEVLFSTIPLADIQEILIVTSSKKASPECLSTCQELENEYPKIVRTVYQKKPFSGGAYQDGMNEAKGTHTLMIASDMETNPSDAQYLLENSKKNPGHIICTTRWKNRNAFHPGYGIIKLVCNFLFQKIFGFLYNTSLSDLTFGYRLYPTSVLQSIHWSELAHPFFFESLIKPLKLGVEATEINTTWLPRYEGDSQQPFFRNFLYLKTGIKILFQNTDNFIRATP